METLRLGLEWFLNPDHVPLLLAEEHGWWAGAGINLEIVEPDERFDAIDAMEAGTIDIAITEPVHLVETHARSHAVVGFARFLHTNGGVMYRTNSSIARPRDMAEARIQYPSAPGPGGLAIVATMVEADGGMFDPEAVTPVNNGFYHTDALADGKADVATLAFYNFELVEAKQRGLDVGFFALKNWGVPDFCQLILTTSAPILEERHRVIQRFVEVLRRGIDCLHQRPGEAQSIYMQRTETAADDVVTGAIFQATLPCFTYDFTMAPAHYDRLAAWMHARGLIDSPVDSAACWTNDLAFPADPALSA